MFLNNVFFQGEVVSTSPNPQAGGPSLVSCPRLLIQIIRSYPPYRRPFFYPQPEDAPCRGDRDPLTRLNTSLIVRKPTPHLHNSKTNWNTYRQIIQVKVILSTKLKEHEAREIETNNFLNFLQRAAKVATPNSDSQRTTNNISYEIKKLVADKRRASSIWQRTHTPESRRICNRRSNKIKFKLQEMRNEYF